MDQNCIADLSLHLGIGGGTAIRENDGIYVSQRNVNGPPLQLDLFPVAPDSGRENDGIYVSQRNVNGPPLQLDLFPVAPDSGRDTLPWENTSASIGTDGVGKVRSERQAKDPIHEVAVSWRSDANKFPASCFSNDDARAINVSSSNSTVDSNATNPRNGCAEIKRKQGDGEELENDRVWSRVLGDVEEEGSSTKKLRLSREQCARLEESFRKNTIPEPKEKQTLALQLNLRPRQVEVWFQNRRARTKLKQTEVDRELLKRYNELLADENRKLHTELEKLKALKMSPPLRSASTLTMCPSCGRVSVADNSSPFTSAKSGPMFLSSHFRQ
eukprot:PITA_20123